jgi:predicted transcriptional regulator
MWLRRVDLVSRFSNPEVLRVLAERGNEGALTQEIRETVGIERAQAGRILVAMEDAGLVRRVRVGHRGHGPGNSDRWFIRRTLVAQALDDLKAFVLEGKGPKPKGRG